MESVLKDIKVKNQGLPGLEATRMELIWEEPLSIRVQGKPYAVVMRTPGDEYAHVAGFCLGEGIVDEPEEIQNIAYCGGEDTNVVTLTVVTERLSKILHILERKGFVSQTSCGICGKELIQDMRQHIEPVPEGPQISVERALKTLSGLKSLQVLYQRTRASHAAAIYSEDFELLSIAEDVGRHNALDKAIGKLFLDKRLSFGKVLILSSRISYELVQKAARARIPFVLAASKPTSLAVELAFNLNMTLASPNYEGGVNIYCGFNRVI
jgi:FdhD protein